MLIVVLWECCGSVVVHAALYCAFLHAASAINSHIHTTPNSMTPHTPLHPPCCTPHHQVVFIKASWHVGEPFTSKYSDWLLAQAEGRPTTQGSFDEPLYRYAVTYVGGEWGWGGKGRGGVGWCE